jgi:hypothetical protein
VRTKTTNEPLDEDLENGSSDESIQEADSGIVNIPEGADADLNNEEHGNRDQSRHESGSPDGNDLVAQGVGEFRIDNLAVVELHCVGLA